MTTRRRPPTRRPTRAKRKPAGLPIRFPVVGPEVARSIFGIVLLVLGAITLISLTIQGQGSLTTWWQRTVGPWFGTLRWMLPILLLGAGWYIEWGPGKRPNSGWGATLLGLAITYLSMLGII